jgi:hypothetical protein
MAKELLPQLVDSACPPASTSVSVHQPNLLFRRAAPRRTFRTTRVLDQDL